MRQIHRRPGSRLHVFICRTAGELYKLPAIVEKDHGESSFVHQSIRRIIRPRRAESFRSYAIFAHEQQTFGRFSLNIGRFFKEFLLFH